jgi:hypothetical protein
MVLLHAGLSAQNGNEAVGNDSINRKKLKGVIVASSATGGGSLVGLYSLWYSGYPQTGFHFINDNNEWRGIDKIGHGMTSFYLGKVGYESLRWCGVGEKKAVWYGGCWGLAYLGAVEVFDGFSAGWGASPGDLAANTLGTALFVGQQLAWHEQRVLLKFSFHLTDFAQYNPDLLGKNLPQRMLKDYNGQSYWLSANLWSLAGKPEKLPKWLNLAFGYGAEGMTGAVRNPVEIDGQILPQYKRYSQFFISPDIDLTRIPTKSRNLRLIFQAIGFIKIPMPALEFSREGTKFHFLYF